MVYRTLKELSSSDGTVQLVGSDTSTSTTRQLLHQHGTDVVLIPQPSEHPDDPLTWPQWKKYIVFLNVCAFAFFTNFSIGALSPAYHLLGLEFHKSVTTVTGLIIWPTLILGLGNFFWVPTAIYFGKRPVFITASLLLFVCNIWGASSRTFGSLLASRLVAAFAGSSTEALGAAIVNDLFFLHERGAKMGIYIISISTGNSLGALIAGFVVTGAGWRWHLWLATICTAINFLSVLFFGPETRFQRSLDREQTSKAENLEKKSNLDTVEIQESETPSEGSAFRRKKSYLQELKIWSGTATETTYLSVFIRPFPLITYPSVVWAFLSYSIALAAVIAVGSLNSFVFQVPPYNFSPSINGLINIPAILGNLFGAYIGGYLTDVYAARQARRNQGIFEPESRLVLLLIPATLTAAGILMFGFGAERYLHWAVLFVGYGLINVSLTGVANIGMTYVMDSYYPVAAEALLLINGLKNIAAFGFLKGLVPWLSVSGYQKLFGAIAGIFLGILCLAIPLYFAGARVRHYTSSRFRLINW